ncbi:MAG: NAD(P)H-hydrate dehydratase [Gammaproteobacteria bacterium]|jgi:NAD(P)H-hydrate epimerase
MSLPEILYRAEQVRALDRIAIEQYQTPGISLMENAGAATFQAMRFRWPRARHVTVFCGGGNNGGDGYVIARLAHEQGLDVSVFWLSDPSQLTGDARLAFGKLTQTAVPVQPFDPSMAVPDGNEDQSQVIVDALLGTGLSGTVKDHWRLAIEWINRAGTARHCRVVAVDIPSGLQADTGAVLGAAVAADLTVTFIGVKQGLLTGSGPQYCGKLVFDDLDVDSAVYQHVECSARRLTPNIVRQLLTPRQKNSHKGDFGHVLIIGGNKGMIGAARMAGEAALRAGAGMVSVVTRPEHVGAIVSSCPELMCHGIESAAELKPRLQAATCVAIGPGLGQDAWAQALLGAVLESSKALVLDADALNLLAQEPVSRDNWVLTPHPGEAGRLLGVATTEIQHDRFVAIHDLQRRYGGAVVLKGSGTLVCDSQGGVSVCDAGNPGMASAGMGDVLTGVTAGYLAQTKDLDQSARTAVLVHALAGDRAAATGERGLMATDLLSPVRELSNPS